jgi:hypothetical protein
MALENALVSPPVARYACVQSISMTVCWSLCDPAYIHTHIRCSPWLWQERSMSIHIRTCNEGLTRCFASQFDSLFCGVQYVSETWDSLRLCKL